MATRLTVEVVRWSLRQPLRTADATVETIDTLRVGLQRGGFAGRGESLGVYWRGETVDSMREDVESVRGRVESGIDRIGLMGCMAAGGGRNAIDSALWDLEAKTSATPAHVVAGIARLEPLHTFFTLGLAPLSRTAADARASAASGRALLKVKLDGDDDEARVSAVRDAAPGARLMVDANQSWASGEVAARAERMARLGVEMIEQPLPRGDDDALAGLALPIPVYADESFETERDLEHAARCYAGVNLKLDKTGGLTAALGLAARSATRGLGLMVGNMCGSSLAMAPAFLLAQHCRYVDLDGPLLNTTDVADGIDYRGSRMAPPTPALWG